jgi:hypothetical protein
MAANVESQDGLEQFLVPLFNVFKHPDVAIGLALAMIVVALIILAWFVTRQMQPILGALRRVQNQLKTITDHSTFSTDFAKIDETISSERFLKHAWEEFKETLITEEPGVIRNTARPSAYLNIGCVASDLHLPTYQAIPNYFVGFGLLFTFLGLVAAIHFASEGVAGDVAHAKESLGNLLTAATFKFATSIAGLISSLTLSIVIRLYIARVQRGFEGVCKLLEQRMTLVTPESLVLQQVIELRKQTVQLERFNTDFAVEIAKSLEERFNASLSNVIGSAVAPMVNAIDGMAKNFGEMNQDAMTQIVGEFKNSIQGAAGSEMTALARTLATVQETLHTTIAGMSKGSGDFGERIERSAERLERMMESASTSLRGDAENVSRELSASIAGIAQEFRTSISGIAELWNGQMSGSATGFVGAVDRAGAALAGKVDATTEKLGEVIMPFADQIKGMESTLHALDSRFKSQISGFDGSVGKMMEFMGRVDHSLNLLRDAGAPIAQTAEKFSAAARQVEVTALAIKESQDRLTEIAKAIHEGAQLVNESWDSYRQRFEKVDVDLSATFDRLQTGTDAYHTRILDYVKQVDAHFTNSLNLLGGGIEQLKDTIEDMVEAATRPPASGGPTPSTNA